MNLQDIAEVQMVNAQVANQYLDNHYVLLAIHPITMQRTDDSGNQYNQLGVTFVVGRDDATPKFISERRENNRNRSPRHEAEKVAEA